MIAVGAYRKGSDPRIDQAIDVWPQLVRFLQQDMYDPVSWETSVRELGALVARLH